MREHAVDPKWVHTMEPGTGPPELEIYGPCGLRRFLRTTTAISWSLLRMSYAVHELHPRPEQVSTCFHRWTAFDLDPVRDKMLPFEREGRDLQPDADGFFRNIFGSEPGAGDGLEDFVVHAFMLDHPVPCVGYLLLEPAPLPRLLVEKAVKLGVKPGPLLGKLKQGESVVIEKEDGSKVTVTPDQVRGPPIRGRRVAILGDSRDSSELRRLLETEFPGTALVVDCMVHEATGHSVEQGDAEMRSKGHSTARGAAAFAATIGVRQLVLNHFSQRFLEEDMYLQCSKDPGKYSKVSSLLEDAKSCKEFKGKVELAADLKVIPIVANIEEEGVPK
uniref:Lactamase_B domain-containing protein n=1 Tax=Mesocestoides corti TaxID=53468 RepID=A0A5K3F407_MESCO